MPIDEKQAEWFAKENNAMIKNIEKGFVGKEYVIRLALTAIVAGGHLLLEDVPGTGKTHLARAISETINGSNKRIQFTPDLLPGDITGISVWNQKDHTFEFHKGPVFANIVLADEINRASPKTQSALLEAMEEGKVTADNDTYDLPNPFLVIATQNPVEQAGTYHLPEAQLDRFMMKTSIGYLDHASTVKVIEGVPKDEKLKSTIKTSSIITMQKIAKDVYIDPMISDYITLLVEATRVSPQVKLGASLRGALALAAASKTWAVAQGRGFVVPDDVKELATVTLAHRLILQAEAEFDGVNAEAIIAEILLNTPVPENRG